MIDLHIIINDLNGRGINCIAIAERVGLAPNSIRELKRGMWSEPRYTAGAKLLALHKLHCPEKHKGMEVRSNSSKRNSPPSPA